MYLRSSPIPQTTSEFFQLPIISGQQLPICTGSEQQFLPGSVATCLPPVDNQSTAKNSWNSTPHLSEFLINPAKCLQYSCCTEKVSIPKVRLLASDKILEEKKKASLIEKKAKWIAKKRQQ